MEFGHLVAAHLEDSNRAIFAYDDLERSAAARADRIAGWAQAAAKLRKLVAGWRPGHAALASGTAAK